MPQKYRELKEITFNENYTNKMDNWEEAVNSLKYAISQN